MKYAEEIEAFRREISRAGDADSFAGCIGLDTADSVEEWIREIKTWENEESCPEGKVPSSMYIAVRLSDNRVVGTIDLRHHINHPILSVWGGHMGYSVRPDERGKGYAKEMLRQNLLNCGQYGIEKVMITCDVDNVASANVILANGGILEKEIDVDGTRMNKYWIDVKDMPSEVWDAYYPDGTLAGVDLVRGEQIPEAYRHAVAEVFVMHKDGSILMMQRDFNKLGFPGFWECGAGGSVVKGETFEEGAKRELREETGISPSSLVEVHTIVTQETIYKGYYCITDAAKESVSLQEGETIAYKWLEKEEFLKMYHSKQCVPRERWDDFVGRMEK